MMSGAATTLRRSLFVSTVAIIVMSIASSLLGLVRSGHYTDDVGLLARIQVEDTILLVFAVPVLAIGLWYTARGSIRGRIVWLGALAYMSYVWLSRAGMLAVNDFFLGYIALWSLSTFTLLAGVVGTAPSPIARQLEGRLSRRLVAGVLVFAAVGLALLWVSELVGALLAGTPPPAIEAFGPRAGITYVLDLGLLVPSCAIGAYLLWHRHQWGYVFAGVLLVFAALVAPTLTAITIVDLREGVAITPGMVLGTVLPPAIPGALALWYLVLLGGTSERAGSTDRRADA